MYVGFIIDGIFKVYFDFCSVEFYRIKNYFKIFLILYLDICSMY